jgi:hypothetical protein
MVSATKGLLEGQKVTPTCRWDDNIKMDVREIGWEDVDWSLVVNCDYFPKQH